MVHIRTIPLLITTLTFLVLSVSFSGAQDALPDTGPEPVVEDNPQLLTDEMQSSEAEYRKLRDSLTDKQKKLLETMEEAYLEALAPEMEIARLGLQLKSCKFSKDEKSEAASIFAAYKLQKENEHQTMVSEVAKKYKKKINFLDPEILSTHIATLLFFGKRVSIDTLKEEIAMLKKQNSESVCGAGKDTLRSFSQ